MSMVSRNGAPFAMLLAGFVLWSLAFVVLYGTQATGCRLGWHTYAIFGGMTLQRLVLILLFLGLLVLHLMLYRLVRRSGNGKDRPRNFTRQASLLLAAAALGASVFCFAGVFWLSPC